MKIAFIGQKGIPAKFGGVERHVEELASRMAREGHEVFVYARMNYVNQKIKKYRGVNLIFTPSISTKHLDTISHTFLSIMHILFHKYDVVHFQSIGPSSLSWIVRFLKPNTQLVATFHCQDYYHQKWNWLARKYLMFGEWVACNIPDQTIVVSKLLQKYVLKKYNKKVNYIPNGSAVNINNRTDKIEQWGLYKQKYILSVGRLIKHKNTHHLIKAFIKLKNNNKIDQDYKLVIVGDGFHTDDYVQKIKKMSLKRLDIILAGNQSGKTLRQLFSNAKLFVQPSKSEGLSLVILEAMGYGLPTLISDIPENKEAVEGSGKIFSVGDIDDLANKIIELTKINTSEKILNRKKVSSIINTKYNWDNITIDTLNIYSLTDKEKSNNIVKTLKV